jgi:hypothetical protein
MVVGGNGFSAFANETARFFHQQLTIFGRLNIAFRFENNSAQISVVLFGKLLSESLEDVVDFVRFIGNQATVLR